jgi:hypothetical protein
MGAKNSKFSHRNSWSSRFLGQIEPKFFMGPFGDLGAGWRVQGEHQPSGPAQPWPARHGESSGVAAVPSQSSIHLCGYPFFLIFSPAKVLLNFGPPGGSRGGRVILKAASTIPPNLHRRVQLLAASLAVCPPYPPDAESVVWAAPYLMNFPPAKSKAK